MHIFYANFFQQCFEASPVHHEAESAPPKDTFWLVTDDDVIDGGDNDNDEAEIWVVDVQASLIKP